MKKKDMRKIIFLTVITLLMAAPAKAQEEKVKWYSINDIEHLLAQEPRPVFIDTYTDWCGWCKRLDADTFSDPIIAKYLNENYYPVKFDAESKEPVTFMGREFINDGKSGKSHQMAIALLQGKMSYPTVVFLNEKGQLVSPVPGYKNPKEFEPILVFFAEKKYLTTKWEDFMAGFKGSF